MLALSRSLLAITCFTCSLTAFGQENLLEDLLNSNSQASSEAATDSKGKLAPISFEDLPFSEYDLDFREWSDATGKFSVVGRLEGFGNGTVLLVRKDNGKEVEVKIELLAQPDVELLESIKKNIKTVEQIREQKEVTDLFADTRKLIKLLEGLRSQLEDEVRKNKNKEPELVHAKRKKLIEDFSQDLLATRELSIPAEVLSIGVAETTLSSVGRGMILGIDAERDSLFVHGLANVKKVPVLILRKQNLSQSTLVLESIRGKSIIKTRFSSKPRSASFGVRTLAGLGDQNTAKGDFERAVRAIFPNTSYLGFGTNIGEAEVFNSLTYATCSVQPVDAKNLNEKLYGNLSVLYKERLLDFQSYDWWGYFGNSNGERKHNIERAKRFSAYQAIANAIGSLTGKQCEFRAYANNEVDRFRVTIKPSRTLYTTNSLNQRIPSGSTNAIYAYCQVLRFESDEETGELTIVVSPPTEEGKDFEKRDVEWYLFRYRPTSADGIVNTNGQFITNGKPGKLVSEKLLAP